MTILTDRYAAMTEKELRLAAEDVKSLTSEAREALKAEFERRHLSLKGVNWKAQPPRERIFPKTTLVGDMAGEYREMQRGKYYAWVHVGIAFALQVVILSALFVAGFELFLRSEAQRPIALSLGINLAVILSVLIYSDRWRCIEAYSSEACTGILNLSIFIVPLLALYYANYRGILKLRKR
jgi:hypothetical protein